MRNEKLKPTFLSLTLSICTLICGAEATALIPYQGYLTRPSPTNSNVHEAVPEGVYDLLFALYTSPVGGETLVWGPERHEDVTVRNGFVDLRIGGALGFDSELQSDPNFFARVLYVGVTVDADGNPNTTDPELVPRQALLPALVTLNTDRLQGADWGTFFDGTDGVGTFTPNQTKTKDANLFDGLDTFAVFTQPIDPASPKARRAMVTDALAGDLDLSGDLQISEDLTVEGLATLQSEIEESVEVEGEISSASGGLTYHPVPRGVILIWSGLVSDIPSGWALCDGENGTPDLRDRFALAVDHDDTGPGGASSHTHTYSGSTDDRGATAGAVAAYVSGPDWFTETHNHGGVGGMTSATDHLPPYYQLAYIMRL